MTKLVRKTEPVKKVVKVRRKPEKTDVRRKRTAADRKHARQQKIEQRKGRDFIENLVHELDQRGLSSVRPWVEAIIVVAEEQRPYLKRTKYLRTTDWKLGIANRTYWHSETDTVLFRQWDLVLVRSRKDLDGRAEVYVPRVKKSLGVRDSYFFIIGRGTLKSFLADVHGYLDQNQDEDQAVA